MFTLADAVREWSIKTPAAPAWWIVVDNQLRSVSWNQVEKACLHVARSLARQGLVAGERLVSYLPNSLSWALLDLACAVRGIIHVPVDRRLPETDLQSILRQTNGVLVRSIDQLWEISSKGAEATRRETMIALASTMPGHDEWELDHWTLNHFDPIDFEQLRVPVGANDPANILFTSGTTRSPLGVVLSHQNLVANARGKLDAVPQFSHDRRLNILPFAHAYARTCELSTWALTGGSMMSVHRYEQLMMYGPHFEPTLLNAVPSIFQRFEQELDVFESTERRKEEFNKRFGKKMRCLASGGAGLPSKTFHFFRELGLPIIQGYGLTEASPVVCSNRLDDPREDCVGPPILQTEIHIDTEQRLYVKGPGVMLGYWNQSSETARRIKNGWLDTGDRAERRSDGSIRILGRMDDRITLSNGYKVDPVLIEQSLIGKCGIRNCMLIGNGQRFIVAIVVADCNQEPNLLQSIQDCLADYPDYCVPKRLIIEPMDWLIGSNLVNPKGGLRRAAIAEHYRHSIAAAYCSTLGRQQVSLNPSNRDEQGGDCTEHGNEVQQ